MNYLPGKLLKLRKHYNYSQSYLAETLGVDVVEYMAYENGRKMINYEQCRKIAALYHVGVIEIFTNDENVTLYEVSKAHTDELNIEYFLPERSFKDKIFDYFKHNPIVVGVSLGVVILGVIFISFFNKDAKPYEAILNNINRLSVSETTVVYIDGNGAVKGSGDNTNGQLSNLPSSNIIKVAEGANFTATLKDDGTVEVNGFFSKYQEDVNKWKNISDIAAGDDHLVALSNVGKVYAIGDNSYGQCGVGDWSFIKKIYTSAHGTIAMDESGKLYCIGEFIGSSQLKNYNNVLDIDTSLDNLVILKSDGKVEYIARNKNFLETNRWSNIIDVCCGNDFVAGLMADGSVVIDIDNYTIENEVANWEGIIAIAAGSDYLIGFDGNKTYGVGKNSYLQFETTEIDTITLAQVSNVKISIGSTVDVKFDKVANASGYLVSLNAGTGMSYRVSNNQVISFDTSIMNNGDNYAITITTLGDDENYLSSNPLVVNFTYYKEEKSDDEEFFDIDVDFAGMDVESFEAYVKQRGASNIIGIETSDICQGDVETILSVEGIANGERISKTQMADRVITYSYCRINYEEEVNE